MVKRRSKQKIAKETWQHPWWIGNDSCPLRLENLTSADTGITLFPYQAYMRSCRLSYQITWSRLSYSPIDYGGCFFFLLYQHREMPFGSQSCKFCNLVCGNYQHLSDTLQSLRCLRYGCWWRRCWRCGWRRGCRCFYGSAIAPAEKFIHVQDSHGSQVSRCRSLEQQFSRAYFGAFPRSRASCNHSFSLPWVSTLPFNAGLLCSLVLFRPSSTCANLWATANDSPGAGARDIRDSPFEPNPLRTFFAIYSREEQRR